MDDSIHTIDWLRHQRYLHSYVSMNENHGMSTIQEISSLSMVTGQPSDSEREPILYDLILDVVSVGRLQHTVSRLESFIRSERIRSIKSLHIGRMRIFLNISMQFFSLYWREIFSCIAVIIAMYSYSLYIHSIFAWKTEPHIFSWGIWALTTGIAFFAQVSGWGWWWAAQNGVTFLVCIFVAFLALTHGKRTKLATLDWWSLILSWVAIVLWFYTSNPFYGSLFAMLADAIGYVPTFRKVWKNPESEPRWYYLLMNVKHGISLIALSVYTWTTMIFSASVIIINFALIVTQFIRNKK
jgi:hypothetical protein